MDTIINIIGALAPGIITGVVLSIWNRKQNKNISDREKEMADNLENELFRLDLEVATAQLSYAVAMAYKRGTPNGEMEMAIKQYGKAMEKFRKYERKQMAKISAD